MGTLYFLIPQFRSGGYQPFFIKHHHRSEFALMSLIREYYVNGVSTRKIDRIAKSMGIDNISSSQVSDISKGLEESVNSLRKAPLK